MAADKFNKITSLLPTTKMAVDLALCQGMSYSKISKLLKKTYDISISYVTIGEYFTQLFKGSPAYVQMQGEVTSKQNKLKEAMLKTSDPIEHKSLSDSSSASLLIDGLLLSLQDEQGSPFPDKDLIEKLTTSIIAQRLLKSQYLNRDDLRKERKDLVVELTGVIIDLLKSHVGIPVEIQTRFLIEYAAKTKQFIERE